MRLENSVVQHIPTQANVSPEELLRLKRLRELQPGQNPPKERPSFGERIADLVAEIMGSWNFIIVQSLLLAIWVMINVVQGLPHWDAYPFILLNLMLSFQAAYAAPIIMMSQNRQADIDRQEAKHDYAVNAKSELEIELLHDKMNVLRGQEIAELKTLLLEQHQQIRALEKLVARSHTRSSNKNALPQELPASSISTECV